MDQEKDERPFSELSRAERREKARRMLFGAPPEGYMGNIWGWRFSLFSFVGLALVGLLALYGVYNGKIDTQRLKQESSQSIFQVAPPTEQNQGVKDTLK